MPFQVTDAERLRVEADRIAGILTMKAIHSNSDGTVRIWEEDEFITHLEGLGLTYTPAELGPLKTELAARGVIQ